MLNFSGDDGDGKVSMWFSPGMVLQEPRFFAFRFGVVELFPLVLLCDGATLGDGNTTGDTTATEDTSNDKIRFVIAGVREGS